MKNNLSNMTGASFGLSFDPAPAAAGGGSAVAAPPAAAAPAPAPAAAAAPPAVAATPAPAKSGFFKDLKRAAVAPPEPAAAAAGAEGQKIQVLDDDGKTLIREFTTQAEADDFVKAGKPATVAAAVPADILAKPFLGRADIATQAAAEELYRKSQTEALRLNDLNKASAAKALDYEARVASLTKELELARKTPAQPDLSDEQLDALFKENPRKANEYMKAKDERDRTNRDSIERSAVEVRERAEATRKIAADTAKNWESMVKDTKTYPQFAELESRIDAIYTASLRDGKSQLFDSNPDAPKMMYRMAMGDIRLELLGKGVEVAASAAETAKLKSESDAAALRAAGGGAGAAEAAKADNRTPEQKSNDEWREARRKARGVDHSRVFKDRTKT